MAASLSRSRGARLAPGSATDDVGCEEWPYLDEAVLRPSRSHKVCLTCHWFRHHSGPNCIPLLTCQLHQGLLAHGEHLTRRCQGAYVVDTRQSEAAHALNGGRPLILLAVPPLWRDFFCSLSKGVERASDVQECCRLIEARLTET